MGGKGSGRRPAPVERQQRLGNPGKRKLPPTSADGTLIVGAFPATAPEPPRALGKYGRALWDQIWLGGAAWLKPSLDHEIALMVCEMVDERVILRAQVLQNSDDWRKRRALRELDRQVSSLLGQLGFSPTDRATLAIGEVREHGLSDLNRRIAAKRHQANG